MGAVVGGGLAAPALVRTAWAQDAFPSKLITFICPFAPGSGADVYARFYAKKFADVSGAKVIVENKLGAGGVIAAEYVARSKPDGYTAFVIPTTAVLATAPAFFKQLPFDPVNDFEHVTALHQTVLVLVVAADSPFKTTQDLVTYLKEKGEDAAYGAVSNLNQTVSEIFKSRFDLKTRVVKFQNFPPALNEMTAGNIAFVFLDNSQSMGHIAGGRVRGLAQTSAERMLAVPDIPGAREAGIPDMDLSMWWSVQLPKGTPSDIVDKYGDLFHKIVADEETVKFLTTSGASPFVLDSAKTKALLQEDVERWVAYAKLAKIEPQ